MRAYERALRSRNALLKSAQPRPREIAAYDLPLIEHGTSLSAMRARLLEATVATPGPLHDEVNALLDRRLEHETDVIGEFQLVARG